MRITNEGSPTGEFASGPAVDESAATPKGAQTTVYESTIRALTARHWPQLGQRVRSGLGLLASREALPDQTAAQLANLAGLNLTKAEAAVEAAMVELACEPELAQRLHSTIGGAHLELDRRREAIRKRADLAAREHQITAITGPLETELRKRLTLLAAQTGSGLSRKELAFASGYGEATVRIYLSEARQALRANGQLAKKLAGVVGDTQPSRTRPSGDAPAPDNLEGLLAEVAAAEPTLAGTNHCLRVTMLLAKERYGLSRKALAVLADRQESTTRQYLTDARKLVDDNDALKKLVYGTKRSGASQGGCSRGGKMGTAALAPEGMKQRVATPRWTTGEAKRPRVRRQRSSTANGGAALGLAPERRETVAGRVAPHPKPQRQAAADAGIDPSEFRTSARRVPRKRPTQASPAPQAPPAAAPQRLPLEDLSTLVLRALGDPIPHLRRDRDKPVTGTLREARYLFVLVATRVGATQADIAKLLAVRERGVDLMLKNAAAFVSDAPETGRLLNDIEAAFRAKTGLAPLMRFTPSRFEVSQERIVALQELITTSSAVQLLELEQGENRARKAAQGLLLIAAAQVFFEPGAAAVKKAAGLRGDFAEALQSARFALQDIRINPIVKVARERFVELEERSNQSAG